MDRRPMVDATTNTASVRDSTAFSRVEGTIPNWTQHQYDSQQVHLCIDTTAGAISPLKLLHFVAKLVLKTTCQRNKIYTRNILMGKANSKNNKMLFSLNNGEF